MLHGGAATFRLCGWSAWAEAGTIPELLLGSTDDGAENTTGAFYFPPGDLPMLLRRRASPVGRRALEAAIGLPQVNEARFVLSSRHSELHRTASILADLADRAHVSPADFSLSVHHGLAGLLSIATANRKGHSAVSAGPESFCYGMLEAATCIAENPDDPVILIHYDERPEKPFATLIPESENGAPIVAAMAMASVTTSEGKAITLEANAGGDGSVSQCHVRDFLRFVVEGMDSFRSHGRRMTWTWGRG
jgi:hypothetical protein